MPKKPQAFPPADWIPVAPDQFATFEVNGQGYVGPSTQRAIAAWDALMATFSGAEWDYWYERHVDVIRDYTGK